jgi:deazaflavin-dependent oxidoreductase (nitroreductase family)
MTGDRPMNITMTAPMADEADVQEMVVIHRIFRREFRLLADVVRRALPGDTRRAGAIAEHLEFILMGLDNHHRTEDEFLWPRLVDRARPHADLIHRMETQHHTVAEHSERAERLLADWRQAPTASSAYLLADTLDRLSCALIEHLDEEETGVLPLVSKHITGAEWAELGQRSFDKFPRSALPIMLGQMLEGATPAEGAMFLGRLPAPVRLVWRLAGRRRYARYIRRVRGNLHPMLSRVGRRANRLAVALYRRSSGRIGGSARGLPVLLMTVPGRRTGTPHTVPIVYWEYDGGYLVTASSGGVTAEPQWFRNIRATERVHIQIGGRVHHVRSRVAASAERDRLWREVILARSPFFAKYEQKAGRTIPIAVLTTITNPSTTG